MTERTFSKAEELFHTALARPREERDSFVDEACHGNRELCREVRQLLAHHDDAKRLLERPVAEAVTRPLAAPPGTRLGTYEILGPLGAGGMGEVYRARDSKLGREVAIKVLPPDVAGDAERLSRFRREATLLAALSHRHVAAIYGLEENDGSPFLVLELVEGEDLADRLKRGPIPIDEALEIARQVAEALEEAHGKGIVHRDLKPANVKLTPDGHVKVLDFGLAKAYAADIPSGVASDFTRSPTLARSDTGAGVILGTASYMSPEQASGNPVDEQADIWSFGVVLFEMLTGQRLFGGETVSEVLASVIEDEPDWMSLPQASPPAIRKLLRRCLEKKRRQRLHDIADARVEIEDAIAGRSETAPVASPVSSRTARTRVAGLAVGALAVGVVGTTLALRVPNAAPPEEVTRMAMVLPDGWVLRSGSGVLGRSARQALALSPDGRHIVYAATDGERAQLFLRAMDREQSVPIPGTGGSLGEGAPSSPFFSPGGQSIGYFAGGQLKTVPLAGGAVRTISVSGVDFARAWASWAEDDTILLVGPEGLLRVPDHGGTPEQLTTVDRSRGELGHIFPEMLPGGEALLFNVRRGEVPSEWDIVAQSIDTGHRRVLVEGGSDPRYVASGHIVFARKGTLVAVPFDVSRLQVTGEPVVVIEDIMQTERGLGGAQRLGDGQLAVSRAGTCIYVPGGVYPAQEWPLGWVDREGQAEPLPIPPARFAWPRVSPDSTRLVYAQGFDELQVWVYDIGLAVPSRLTSRGVNVSPVWSPDGTRVVFAADGGDGSPLGLFWMAADGRGRPQRLTEAARGHQPSSWSPDGVLAFVEDTGAGWEIMVLDMEGGGEPVPFLQTPFSETHPAFSPDGNWLAYNSDATGQLEVYVRSFPSGEPEHRISTEGGWAPLWSPDGRQLFYKTRADRGITVMAVDVTAGETFVRSRPRSVLSGNYGSTYPTRSYDIAPDGQRFVTSLHLETEPEQVRMTRINVILNWHEELRRLAPAE